MEQEGETSIFDIMKKIFLPLVLIFLLGCNQNSTPIDGSWFPDAVNPLTYTDIPDNDVIRVGEDYYMVSTTMFFCPGAPIMHSKDLVHWRIVSYIYDVLEDDDVYRLEDGKNAYGKGQWATSLRYHDGMYYALFVANDQKKSYLYRTADIVNGPWERSVFDKWFFHDPGLLFDDDGRLWVVWGNGDLRLTELKADGSGVIGGDDIIIRAPKEGMGLRAEGAHFYHIGPYYYVLEIDWPREDIRQATVWRSKDIHGPYESRVVLKGTLDGRPKDGIAQGPMVDTPSGEWYAIQFQDHGAVGRIPTVQPVTWVDGWPIMGADGTPLQDVSVNLPEDPAGNYVWDSDEFDGDKLALVWQWNHKAPDDWKLEEGRLILKSHPATGIHDARGTLTQRTVGPRCESVVRLDVSDLQVGDEAGICAFQSYGARIGVKVSPDGQHLLILTESYPTRKGRKEKKVLQLPLGMDHIYLRIRYVFTPLDANDTPDTAFFGYSDDGENWKEIPYTLNMKYTLDYFIGYRTGLYCFGPGSGSAAFDFFRQRVY